jgi:hemerythrin-like domain-containing protein
MAPHSVHATCHEKDRKGPRFCREIVAHAGGAAQPMHDRAHGARQWAVACVGETMDPFEQLSAEHALIQAVVEAFEETVESVAKGESIERAELDQFLSFFRDFVDLGHHDKEETVFLPALVRSGFRWEEGAIARIHQEHDQERSLLRSLSHAAGQDSEWSDDLRRRFAALARELIAFQRAHIEHEEWLLFPEAKKRLPPGVAEQVAQEFARLDAERGSGALWRLGEEIISRHRRAD